MQTGGQLTFVAIVIDEQRYFRKVTLLELVGWKVTNDLAVNARTPVEVAVAIVHRTSVETCRFSSLSRCVELSRIDCAQALDVGAVCSAQNFCVLGLEDGVVVEGLPPWVLCDHCSEGWVGFSTIQDLKRSQRRLDKSSQYGLTIWDITAPPPALPPMMVTLDGSPPKGRMLR